MTAATGDRPTPGQCIDRLNTLATELDDISSALYTIERERESREREYEQFISDHEVGLWKQHEDGDLKRWPAERTRVSLAHRDMDPVLLGSYVGLEKARQRALKRIQVIGKEIDAWRSILSALKSEIEATR